MTDKEYLAVATLRTNVPLKHAPTVDEKSILQIWSLDTSVATDLARVTTETKGAGMVFEYGLCHNLGQAFTIAWCPKGGQVDPDDMEVDESESLGIIAGSFSDGSVSLFAVPHPRLFAAKVDETQNFRTHQPHGSHRVHG